MNHLLWITVMSLWCSVVVSSSVQRRSVQRVVPLLDADLLVNVAAERSNMTHFMSAELDPFLIERVSGTPGNVRVREHIIHQLSNLSAGWHIDVDKFTDSTPYGVKPFVNVVATLNPRARRRLVLACHFDSKYFANIEFIGATDSAVPCAMLINLARVFNYELKHRTNRHDTTLQLIFFDGEEAFVRWNRYDSLYGSRHLAAKMHATLHPYHQSLNELQAMDAFVLLDLLGNSRPTLLNYFTATSHLFKAMQSIESRLAEQDLLMNFVQPIFSSTSPRSSIQDDHVPFMQRGVPILHLIANPFPFTWHKAIDTKDNLDVATIDNLNRIMRVFVAEYLHLDVQRAEPLTPASASPITTTTSDASSTSASPTTIVMSSVFASISAIASLTETLDGEVREAPTPGPAHSTETPAGTATSSSPSTSPSSGAAPPSGDNTDAAIAGDSSTTPPATETGTSSSGYNHIHVVGAVASVTVLLSLVTLLASKDLA